jgi:TolB-like protein
VLATTDIFEFEDFRLDRRGDGLSRRDERGQFVPVAIGPRALDVLAMLVERAGQLVLKEDIMGAVWGQTVVENANLTVQISALRRVLDQGRSEESCIQTVTARGYRFLPVVTRVEQAAAPQIIAPRLSIVVLPFADLSEDRRQQYFADGLTDDLTTDLSRLQNVLVISRNTAFTYKDQRVDAKQIGRELGVRYVLEGSVRRSGNQVRVNAQLIDAATDTHLWAERFDHDIGDLFALQNEITGRIANTLGWQLIGAETARTTDRLDALDYLLRGRAVRGTGGVRENVERAVDLFERALALDPSLVEAQSRLANALIIRATHKDPGAAAVDLKRAEGLIAQALASFPSDPYTHRVKGLLLRITRRSEEAIPEFEISLSVNRNDPYALIELSICEYLIGGSDREAIALAEQAIRLSPRDPNMGWWYTWIGFVHLLQSRIVEAIAWLERARSLDPKGWNTHQFLAAAYGSKGDLERARSELAETKRLIGSDRYSSVARSRANGDLYTPALRDRWETVYFPGIRAAGQPEE